MAVVCEKCEKVWRFRGVLTPQNQLNNYHALAFQTRWSTISNTLINAS